MSSSTTDCTFKLTILTHVVLFSLSLFSIYVRLHVVITAAPSATSFGPNDVITWTFVAATSGSDYTKQMNRGFIRASAGTLTVSSEQSAGTVVRQIALAPTSGCAPFNVIWTAPADVSSPLLAVGGVTAVVSTSALAAPIIAGVAPRVTRPLARCCRSRLLLLLKKFIEVLFYSLCNYVQALMSSSRSRCLTFS